MPGPLGKRFDYLTIDPDDHYLISAHLAAGQTYVIDLRTNKVVATVADTPGAEGVEYVSDLFDSVLPENEFLSFDAGLKPATSNRVLI